MQITSLSVEIRRINENNPNQQGAIPKNSLFQPRQNRFVYRTTRQRNPIPFIVRLALKAISLNPRPQRKQGARVLYNDVEFSLQVPW
jgi:hypothetical protein